MFNQTLDRFSGVTRAPRAAAAPSPRKVTRKDFTDRLGIPENCTQAELDAALDRIKPRAAAKPAPARATAPASAEDALYALAWGHEDTEPSTPGTPRKPARARTQASTDDALYAAAWGTDAKDA